MPALERQKAYTVRRAGREDYEKALLAWDASGAAKSLSAGRFVEGMEQGGIEYLLLCDPVGFPALGVGVCYGGDGSATLAALFRFDGEAGELLADCRILLDAASERMRANGVRKVYAVIDWAHPRRETLARLYERLLGAQRESLILAASHF